MKVHCRLPAAPTAGLLLTLQALIPNGNGDGQAAETNVVKAGVASLITRVIKGWVPLGSTVLVPPNVEAPGPLLLQLMLPV